MNVLFPKMFTVIGSNRIAINVNLITATLPPNEIIPKEAAMLAGLLALFYSDEQYANLPG